MLDYIMHEISKLNTKTKCGYSSSNILKTNKTRVIELSVCGRLYLCIMK